MHELRDLKASEVKLREFLRNEHKKEFKADIRYALKLVRVRRIKAERILGIGD